MPKYQDLYQDLAKKILEGTIKEDTWLPSEPQLMEQYGTGKDTVRKALSMLAQDGYIQKEHGKGSLVLHVENQPQLLDLAAYPYLPEAPGCETKVHSVRLIQPTGEIARSLGYTARHKVWKVQRTRCIDGEPAVLETDYIDPTIVTDLDMDSARIPAWQHVQDELGLDVGYSRKEITLRPASAREASGLRLQPGQLVVVVRSWTSLEDARRLEYTVAKHHPDKFRYTDFLRKNKKG